MHLLSDYIGEYETKNRLINCLLINRHYVLVLEKKVIDFTDFVEIQKPIEEKEEIAKKFAFTRS